MENRVNPIMVVVVDLAVNGHKHLIYIPEHAHVSAFFFESSVERFLPAIFPGTGLGALAREDMIGKEMCPKDRAVIFTSLIGMKR